VSVDRLRDRVLATGAPGWVILIRIMVGAVFLSEGVQKILYPAELGAGRFARIGLPAPEALGRSPRSRSRGSGVGRLPHPRRRGALITIMVVAIATTKVPILLAGGVGRWRTRRGPTGRCPGALYLLVGEGARGPWTPEGFARGRSPFRVVD
jgi:uncharacterized membrane protein YphA (DoxX/SURF4 family)